MRGFFLISCRGEIFVAFDAASADFHSAAVHELCPLEVDLLGNGAGWVKFGRTNTVGVTSTGG